MTTQNEPSSKDKVEPATPRRPYRAPTLRRLGSVREVTWGSGMGNEGGLVGAPLMKGM